MKKCTRGFTLLEVVITLGILIFVMGYFSSYFSSEIRLYYAKDNQIELKQDARIALDRVMGKIRSENGLSFVPGPNGTGVIYKGSQIIINTTKNDLNGEINYSFEPEKGYGKISDAAGNKIVDNIQEFKLEKQDISGAGSLIKILISCKSNRLDDVKQYSTSVRMFWHDRYYVILFLYRKYCFLWLIKELSRWHQIKKLAQSWYM